MFFRIEERTTVILVSRSFAYRQWQWRFTRKRRGLNSTPHCTHLSRATHAFFLVCTWLKFWSPALDRIVGLQFLRVLKVVPSYPCFTAPCLTHSCLRTSLHRFLHLHLVRLPLLHWKILRGVHPLCKEGDTLVRLAGQSPLTGQEPKSLIEVSSERVPINSPSSRGSLDTILDDLATTVNASEVYGTTENGTVDFTTVFSGARNKCCPTRCFQFSGTFERGETHAGRGSVFERGEIHAGR